MLKTQRQQKIIYEIEHKELVSVADLTTNLHVSEITIRRDLDELEKLGKIQRVRGGARSNDSALSEPPVVQRQLDQIAEKDAIAARAVEFIEDGETIALESGSTAMALARKIAAQKWQNLQVVTNSVPILNLLLRVRGINIVFAGGFVDANELCSYGKFTEETLSHFHIAKYFCGCRSLDLRFGRTNEFQTGIEVGTVRAFAMASDKIFALVDHTKFGRQYPLQLLPLEDIDIVITSTKASAEVLAWLQEHGIETIAVSVDGKHHNRC